MFLGLDIGTSGVKAILVDERDRPHGEASSPLTVERPQPLWSEQDPESWWAAVEAVLDRLAADRPTAMERVEVTTDEIHVPPMSAFQTAASYYNVALHELTHWTGHPSRCNRDLTGFALVCLIIY